MAQSCGTARDVPPSRSAVPQSGSGDSTPRSSGLCRSFSSAGTPCSWSGAAGGQKRSVCVPRWQNSSVLVYVQLA